MHKINFTGETPEYCPAAPGLRCFALVDGVPATYDITAEALEDHFGARSCCREDLILAYGRNREAIERVASRFFDLTGALHVALHGGHFRFAI